MKRLSFCRICGRRLAHAKPALVAVCSKCKLDEKRKNAKVAIGG